MNFGGRWRRRGGFREEGPLDGEQAMSAARVMIWLIVGEQDARGVTAVVWEARWS